MRLFAYAASNYLLTLNTDMASKEGGGPVTLDTDALNLRWSFGFNSKTPGCVLSLVTPERKAIFYVSGHTGVILDTTTDRQYLLQGHVRFPLVHVFRLNWLLRNGIRCWLKMYYALRCKHSTSNAF